MICTFQRCLLCKSRMKGSQCLALHVVHRCKRPPENCLLSISTSRFSIILASSKFFQEFPTSVPTLMNVISRGWDQIHSICLKQHLIKATMTKTPSIRMRPTCRGDLNHASLDSDPGSWTNHTGLRVCFRKPRGFLFKFFIGSSS